MATEKRLDLIDRNELLKVLIHRVRGNEDNFIILGTNNTLGLVEEFVRSITAIDAVPVVHGRWEDVYGGKYENPRFRCSVCKRKALYVPVQGMLGAWSDTQALSKYCPNCGAKMDGERKDND